MKKPCYKRGLALLLAVCTLLNCAACGSKTEAAAMRLRKAEGTVGVSDSENQAIEPAENLGLYSGYGVDTQSESYAWVDLDSVKLTKLDQNSEIQITQSGKKLDIEVKSGSLFFNITEPLAEDESLDIRSSTMMVGIRGTCGWVEVPDPEHMTLCLLEGTVECTAGEETAAVTAGERAKLSVVDGQGVITISALQETDIPAFAADELDDQLTAEAAQAMTEAQERYPISRFQSRADYIDPDQLSVQIKDGFLQVYEAASGEDWDTVQALLLAMHNMEAGRSEGDPAPFYTDYEGFRLWFARSGSSTVLYIRPQSGTGFDLTCAPGYFERTTVQCENYCRTGSFYYWQKYDEFDYFEYESGYVADGLLDGEITGSRGTSRYVNGLQEGTSNADLGWATIGNTKTFSPDSSIWSD